MDPAFNTLSSKSAANATSLSAPSGFTPALVLQPNATYYWRINVGGNSYLPGPDFSVPFCDLAPPATTISNVTGWQSINFPLAFADTDNVALGKRFYGVFDFDGTEWRANGKRGFFNDNFDNNTLHPDWTSFTGTWATGAGFLNQSDENSSNTNLATPLTQNLSNRYLYHWNAKIDGSGTARAAGFHFFCDSASLSNRGNSYFVLFDIDAGKLQFYKVSNNISNLVKDVPFSFTAGQFYDFKVAYDRISGKMDVYVNNVLADSWVDAAPLSTGNAVSFRTVNANTAINYFEVFRSRPANATIRVGTGNTNDIRYQNAAPSFAAGKIKSLVTDLEGNLSAMPSTTVNVDWTAPSGITPVNDGTGADINTTYLTNQLSANWPAAADTNSGIVKYYYSIGTTAGDTDLVGWTDNLLQVMVMKSNLSLALNQLYYFNVKAENGAGLYSPITSSNGQKVVLNTTNIDEPDAVPEVNVYPNPFNNTTTIVYTLVKAEQVDISLKDVLGKQIKQLKSEKQGEGNHKILINAAEAGIAVGIYFVEFKTEDATAYIKLVCQQMK